MLKEWAGRSERDREVTAHVERNLVPGRRACFPATLLLGPRGSGKTTLLRHLEDWGAAVPVARLDIADREWRGKRPLAVLQELAERLAPRKKDMPGLGFAAFNTLARAATADLPADRAAALRELEILLARPPADPSGAGATVLDVLDAFSLPPHIRAALRVAVPVGRWSKPHLVRRWRLAQIRRYADRRQLADPLDYLYELNKDHRATDRDRRRIAAQDLYAAFLDDLRGAYGDRLDGGDGTPRCLVLIDNVDSDLGNRFLKLLCEARRAPDPLLLVCTAGSYPEVFESAGFWFSPGAPLPNGWDTGHAEFRPERRSDALLVGQLRDLHRREVEGQAEELLQALAAVGRPGGTPESDHPVAWLGWALYELTRGQPVVLRRLTEALLEHGTQPRWDDRLRHAVTPGLRGKLLNRLLPIRSTPELRAVLVRAAACPDLLRAREAKKVWDGVGDAARKEFDDFVTDPLTTEHAHARGAQAEGEPPVPTLHPALRHLLLHELAAAEGDQWTALHTAIRDEPGAADQRAARRLAAYHAMSAGDLRPAAVYLTERFEQGTPESWCGDLCRLRRAPLRAPREGGSADPFTRYEEAVAFVNDSAVDGRLRTVARLLAASWIGPEPRTASATDRAGDPYRDPLGDPYQELHQAVVVHFNTLATHAERGDWNKELLAKAKQYRGSDGS
jgi:hypothetical protein